MWKMLPAQSVIAWGGFAFNAGIICRLPLRPSREKANQENPQIFLICKYKNNFSAIISQSERGGNSKSLLLSLYKPSALC